MRAQLDLSLRQPLSQPNVAGPELVGSMTPTPVRSRRRKAVFIVLAGVLAGIGALLSGYYFTMRPVPLRIAVGPPNSDDVRVVQKAYGRRMLDALPPARRLVTSWASAQREIAAFYRTPR